MKLQDFKTKNVGDNDNLKSLKFEIGGPDGTPYAGGIFIVQLMMPGSYPFSPPQVTFKTPVWHPNISSRTGYVCFNTLKEKWRPIFDVRLVLVTLRELLREPNGESPQDAISGAQFNNSFELFSKTAQMWTYIHAKGEECESNLLAMIKKLEEMNLGDSDKHRLRELSISNWDISTAVEGLIGPNYNLGDEDDDLPVLDLGPNINYH